MADKINGIQGVSYNSYSVQRVRNYSPKEREEKIKQLEAEYKEKAEVRNYLAKYKNPENLSFKELLDQAMQPEPEDDEDYILDISFNKK